jgi:hypothetical protein
MARLLVPIENAVPIYGPAKNQITIINNDPANICYVSEDPQRLNAAPVGGVSANYGQPLAAAGGELQIDTFRGKWYARANVAMQIEVIY